MLSGNIATHTLNNNCRNPDIITLYIRVSTAPHTSACHMKYFIAVVPPNKLAAQIAAMQATWGQNALPPHITVKAPNSLPDSEWWLPEIKALCERSMPIPVSLDGIGQFASTVLYWRVTSPGLIALHQALLTILNPPPAERTAYFEGPAYVPHLTLLHGGQGLDAAAFESARTQVAILDSQPTKFMATQLIVFKAIEPHQSYQIYQDFTLAG